MKKSLFVTIIVVLLITASCSEIEELLPETEEEFQEVGLPIEDDAETLPITTGEHILDERAMLIKGIEEQKKLHKLGFITDEFPMINTQIAYYPLEDTVGYSSLYQIPDHQTFFKFEGGTSFESSLYEMMEEQLVDTEEIEHDSLEAIYGKYQEDKDGEYYVIAKNEDLSYIIQIGNEAEGFTNKIVKSIGNTLRTEADGVYDPFYQQFALDIDKLQFPTINDKRAVIHDANIYNWEKDKHSGIHITYMLSEQDTLTYTIENAEKNIPDAFQSEDTFTVHDDIEVTEYHDENKDAISLFHWQVDDYDYTLEVHITNKGVITKEEIEDIIASSFTDDRTFKKQDVLEAENKKPNRTKAEKKVSKSLKNMKE